MSFEREIGSLEAVSEKNRRYQVQRRIVTIEDAKYECVAGIDSKIIAAISEDVEFEKIESVSDSEPDSAFSQFSDGTMFQLRRLRG